LPQAARAEVAARKSEVNINGEKEEVIHDPQSEPKKGTQEAQHCNRPQEKGIYLPWIRSRRAEGNAIVAL
jgi:hypothetical protein